MTYFTVYEKFGGKMKLRESGKAKTWQVEDLPAGEARKAIVWPNPGVKSRNL